MAVVTPLNTQGSYPVEHLVNGRGGVPAPLTVQHEPSNRSALPSATQGKLGRSRFELTLKRQISKTRNPTNTESEQGNNEGVNFKQDGNQYFFHIESDKENLPKRLAFEDKDNEIVASSDDEHAARRMVELAIEKGWKPIQAQGTDAFKEAVRKAAKELNVSLKEEPSTQLNNKVALTEADLAKVENAKKNKLTNGAVFSGHGEFRNYGDTTVPEGTSITFYSEHGSKISDELGNMIEEQKDVSKLYKKTYKAGEIIPNYMLLPPKSLEIKGDPITVKKPTPLSSLLKPNMGSVSWAACTWDPQSQNSKNEFHVDGILDGNSSKYITRYNLNT